MNHFIVEFKQAFSADFCQHLIAKFAQDQHKSAGQTGSGIDQNKKHSTDLVISHFESWQKETLHINNILNQALVAYTRAFPFMLTGPISPSFMDPVTGKSQTLTHQDIEKLSDEQLHLITSKIYQVDNINLQYYQQQTGGYFHWHSEHFPHPNDSKQNSLRRVLLWLVYLNDVEHGGETEFFYQQTKIKPTQGSLILSPCGFTHTHRGNSPESGDKYVLASWISYQEASAIYAANK